MQKHKAYEHYLVGLARLGDRAGFERLVQQFSARFFGHAYRLLGHREEARDAVQEAWVEITRNLGKLRDDAAFTTWAYRIVSRRCARQIARNIKDREVAADVIFVERDFDETHSVHAAIKKLPATHAATVRLFYIEEMNLREVAIAMDVPEGTVKSRLNSAREKLKNHLKGYENAKY